MNEQNDKIGVAVIGAGNRARSVMKSLLRDSGGQVEIVSVFDPDRALMTESVGLWNHTGHARECATFEEALAAPGVEWVMIFSPNVFHKEQIIAAFRAGKHVFSEKPLATTIADCCEIYAAHQASDRLFATGFVLRYAPIYRKTKEILDSGILGRLMVIEGNENITPDHGGYIMCNWRRKTEISGPHLLEKCCHDLDLILWYTDSLPSRVATFGGRSFFRPENRPLEEKYGVKQFKSWWDPHALETPFHDDTDLMDHTVSIAAFRNGVKLSFTATMSNAIPERRLSFACTEGTMKVELYEGTLRYRRLGDEADTVLDTACDGHGGGDAYIMKELYHSMTTGTIPACGGDEGLESAVFALALDQSAREGGMVDLEPVWREMNR